MAIRLHHGTTRARGWRPESRHGIVAAVIVASLLLAAVAGWWLGTRGGSDESSATSGAITQGGTLVLGDGTPALTLPDGWQTAPSGSTRSAEVYSGTELSLRDARLVVSHGPSDVIPMDPAWYTAADIYVPEGAIAGSAYVTHTDERSGAFVIAFVVPLEDGSFLTGQGVLARAADEELRAQLVAVSESAALG